MTRPTFDTSDLRRLTDVQLIHRVNDAIAAREIDAGTSIPSRAGLLLRHGLFRGRLGCACIAFAVQTRDLLHGGFLALRMANPARLAAWSQASDARMAAIIADIAILRMLGEMERRVAREARRAGPPVPSVRGA
jgi:hypothetical protein